MNAADAWLYERFVKFLVPDSYDADEGLLRGLSVSLPHRRKPGVRMRIGVGSGVLITKDRVLVAADVVPSREPSGNVAWHGISDLSAYRMAADVIMDPPEPPYLFVAFGKRPDIRSSLRIAVSRDIVELSGEGAMTIRRRPVVEAYERLKGVPLPVYRTLTSLVFRRLRDPGSKLVADAIARIIEKQGDKGRLALEIAECGPQRNTTEYVALSRLLTAREKGLKSVTAAAEA